MGLPKEKPSEYHQVKLEEQKQRQDPSPKPSEKLSEKRRSEMDFSLSRTGKSHLGDPLPSNLLSTPNEDLAGASSLMIARMMDELKVHLKVFLTDELNTHVAQLSENIDVLAKKAELNAKSIKTNRSDIDALREQAVHDRQTLKKLSEDAQKQNNINKLRFEKLTNEDKEVARCLEEIKNRLSEAGLNIDLDATGKTNLLKVQTQRSGMDAKASSATTPLQLERTHQRSGSMGEVLADASSSLMLG